MLLCRSEQVFVATRRGEAVLERIRNKRKVSKVLLFYFFFGSQDSYANQPFSTTRGETGGALRIPVCGPVDKDFLAVLRATPTGTGASQQGWQGQRAGESVCECENSSAPHLSSLTVGEWSPRD